MLPFRDSFLASKSFFCYFKMSGRLATGGRGQNHAIYNTNVNWSGFLVWCGAKVLSQCLSGTVVRVSCTFWCNISNMKDHVWPHFQTPRRDLKIRRTAEYFWQTSRWLEIWSNSVLSVWYILVKKVKLRRKRRNNIVKIYINWNQISKHRHGHDFLCLNLIWVWECCIGAF